MKQNKGDRSTIRRNLLGGAAVAVECCRQSDPLLSVSHRDPSSCRGIPLRGLLWELYILETSLGLQTMVYAV